MKIRPAANSVIVHKADSYLCLCAQFTVRANHPTPHIDNIDLLEKTFQLFYEREEVTNIEF